MDEIGKNSVKPSTSPITAAANAGHVGTNGEIPDVNQLRIPVKYLANLLTAGDTAPVVRALERMLAMRAYQRSKHVDGEANLAAIEQVRMTVNEVEGVEFGVNFIPHTQGATTWGEVAAGDKVNIEVDTIGRYVARLREYD